MKWSGGMVLVGVLALLAAASAGAAAPRLPMHEARSEAESQAFTFTLRRNLNESHVGRCHRRSATKVDCVAIAKGESKAAVVVCQLHISVRLIRHRYYDETVGAIRRHRCAKTLKEQLTYAEALAAIQPAADAFAGTPTSITYMFRRDDVTYKGTAHWKRPAVQPSEYLLTESCSADLVATLAEGNVSVVVEGFSCY